MSVGVGVQDNAPTLASASLRPSLPALRGGGI